MDVSDSSRRWERLRDYLLNLFMFYFMVLSHPSSMGSFVLNYIGVDYMNSDSPLWSMLGHKFDGI